MDVFFEALPFATFVADLFAVRADRDDAAEGAQFGDGLLLSGEALSDFVLLFEPPTHHHHADGVNEEQVEEVSLEVTGHVAGKPEYAQADYPGRHEQRRNDLAKEGVRYPSVHDDEDGEDRAHREDR